MTTQTPQGDAPPSAPLRADARRNRDRLKTTAATLLAAVGTEVSIAQIAAEAGVGKGTVFRHYASKDELVAEVVGDVLQKLLGDGRDIIASHEPGEALRVFMTAVMELQARNRAFCEVVAGASGGSEQVRAAVGDLHALTDQLAEQAVLAGAVRPDITGLDIALLLSGIFQTAAPMTERDPQLWRRYLTLALDGLLPQHASDLHDIPRAAAEQASRP